MSDLPEIYQGDLPEQITSVQIDQRLDPDMLELRPALSLIGEIQVSQYGAICFTLIDSKPENRVRDKNPASDYYMYEGCDEQPDLEFGAEAEPFEKSSRFYRTRDGFKIIRYTILPEPLLEALNTNKWVGPAVLRQAFEDSVAPNEFFEEPVPLQEAFFTSATRSQDEEQDRKVFDGKLQYLQEILKQLDASIEYPIMRSEVDCSGGAAWWRGSPGHTVANLKFPDNHRAYMSFHPWVYLGKVQAELPSMVKRTLDNIDELMRTVVDRDGKALEALRAQLGEDDRYLPIARLAISSADAAPEDLSTAD